MQLSCSLVKIMQAFTVIVLNGSTFENEGPFKKHQITIWNVKCNLCMILMIKLIALIVEIIFFSGETNFFDSMTCIILVVQWTFRLLILDWSYTFELQHCKIFRTNFGNVAAVTAGAVNDYECPTLHISSSTQGALHSRHCQKALAWWPSPLHVTDSSWFPSGTYHRSI